MGRNGLRGGSDEVRDRVHWGWNVVKKKRREKQYCRVETGLGGGAGRCYRVIAKLSLGCSCKE